MVAPCFQPLPFASAPCSYAAPMTDLARPAPSLAWRIAVAAVLLRLAYTALVQAYSLMGPSPYLDQVRESFTQPPVLAPLLANVASTLLIVGGLDDVVLGLNRQAQAQLHCENRLTVVPGATHLFEEPGTLQAAAELARDWFTDHLAPVAHSAGGW